MKQGLPNAAISRCKKSNLWMPARLVPPQNIHDMMILMTPVMMADPEKYNSNMKKRAMIIIVFMAFIWLTGFNLDNASVPRNEILSGGPPKDGIPAILEPNFFLPIRRHI